jgi:hypothetical protein
MDHDTAIARQAAERYWHGGLSSSEREEYEEHFFSCAECAEEVRWERLFLEQARAELDRTEERDGLEPQFFVLHHLPCEQPVEIYREARLFALAFDVPADRRFYSYTIEIDDRFVGSLAAPREPNGALHLALPLSKLALGEHDLLIRGARAAEIVRCRFRIL